MGTVPVTRLSDVELARRIAVEAGVLLCDIRARADHGGKALGDQGDAQANRLILDRLHAARPDDFVLSEESTDDRIRCGAQRVWIVDPLDGTREYAEGRDDWAVHIALSIDGRPDAAAVSLPAAARVLTTDDAAPDYPALPAVPRMVVSRSRPHPVTLHVATAIGAELLPMGSAGAKAMAVVDGIADAYLHDGGQYEWDNCAPAAVAMAAGLHASRIDGSPLVYNGRNPFLPDLLICRRELAEPILAEIRTFKASRQS